MMDARTRRSLEHIERRLFALQRKMRQPARTDRGALEIYNRATIAHIHVTAALVEEVQPCPSNKPQQ